MNRRKFIQWTTMGLLCVPFVKLNGESPKETPKKRTFFKIHRVIADDGTKGDWIGVEPIKFKDIKAGDSIMSFDEYYPKGLLWNIHGWTPEGLVADIEKDFNL